MASQPAAPLRQVTASAHQNGIIVGGPGQLSGQVCQVLHPRARRPGRRLHHPGLRRVRPPSRTAPTPPLSAAPEEKDRWISVSWGDTHQDAYQTSLDITAKDRQNLFLDVAAALSAAQVRVDSLSAKGTPDGFAVITAQLQVHSKDEINAVMRKLNGVNGVMTVNRAKG